MKNLSRIAFVALVAAVAPLAWADGDCCKHAMVSNGWCDHCKHGYYNSVEIKSQKVHTALQGERLKGTPNCADCAKALASGGVCSHCHIGFAKNMAYKSMVGYELARGEHVDVATIKCEGCRKAAADHGWCDVCKAGMVGCERYTDKAAYEAAVEARTILCAAVKAKCEGCGAAMVTDGKCEACNVVYKDGKPTKG